MVFEIFPFNSYTVDRPLYIFLWALVSETEEPFGCCIRFHARFSVSSNSCIPAVIPSAVKKQPPLQLGFYLYTGVLYSMLSYTCLYAC